MFVDFSHNTKTHFIIDISKEWRTEKDVIPSAMIIISKTQLNNKTRENLEPIDGRFKVKF